MTAAPSGSGAMFDAIAQRYDLLNRLISLGVDKRWRARTVRAIVPAVRDTVATPRGAKLRAKVARGERRVLDLATGTGDLALAIAEALPEARVVGVDPSANMLEVFREKLGSLTDRVEVLEGDAQALPFADASFDATTIAFGIRNVPDRARGLAEMARVTRAGGRVAVLELSEPREGLIAPFARFHVHTVVPAIGAWLSGKREYRYLARSIAAFPPAEEFAAMMEAAGLAVIEIVPMTFGTCTLYVAERRPQAVQAHEHAASQAALSGSAPASERRGAYSTYVTRPSADVSPDQRRLGSRPLPAPERLRRRPR